MKLIRSLLCVPAHKPALYEKAARSAADCLMFDLEDSTPTQHKGFALSALHEYLVRARTALGKLVAIRFNPERALSELPLRRLCDIAVVPKITSAGGLSGWSNPFDAAPLALLPVIETPQAILNLKAILGLPGVIGGIFGVADFAAGMGVSDRIAFGGTDSLHQVNRRFLYAKQKLATYAAAFGKQALDTCFAVKGDRIRDRVAQAWDEARSFGFTGAACIHPVQVATANVVFGPSQVEREWAARIHADHADRRGEVGVDRHGLVVGLPVDRQARAIIARSQS